MGEGISKAVLITGCSTGIGRDTAVRLANAGWTVYATARKLDAVKDLEQHGCKILALDVTDAGSMRAAVDAVESAEGAVGVLINNAGYGQSGAIESVPIAKVRAQFETNVFGLVHLTQMVLPGMRGQGWGRIVNVSSMGGKLVFPGGGFYHASKYAVEAISDALRFEVAPFGVKVVVVEPGIIRTEFASNISRQFDGVPQDGGPYGPFNAAVKKTTNEAYEKGPLAMLGGGPDAVAKAIHKAIVARNPKPRYKVTASAHMLVNQRRIMTDRMWDGFLRTQFPQPGKTT